MALRARLVAPPPETQREWQWHAVTSTSLSASTLFSGQRRMEAETYLTAGYGIRLAIEARAGWVKFSELAHASAPPRIKQVLVSPEYGIPYLNTSQVFDVRPKPRNGYPWTKRSRGKLGSLRKGPFW